MFKFCSYFYNYTRLLYSIYNYILIYTNTNEHNIILLDNIIYRIKECGSVAIKFCQWVTPKLEMMYIEENNLLNKNFIKPLWLTKFESFYENCDNHSLEYTISEYENIFNEKFNDKYEILSILASGSIGQVYLIQNKPLMKNIKPSKYVMKILHPNVKYEINFFGKFYKIINYIPLIKNLIQNNFPFDIYKFIDQFKEQSNFIIESNHLLHFKENYKNNDYIIIPELIQTSSSIMIMSYEEGIQFEKLNINKYQKYKIAALFTLFLKNNQHILNYNHGDLHKGNWKIKISENNDYKLIIYDFGFCWHLSPKNEKLINLITETFESSGRTTKSNDIENLTTIIKYLVIYDKEDKDNFYDRIHLYISNQIENLEMWIFSPILLFKIAIKFCLQENLLIDSTLIQCVIIGIQGQIIFEEYGLQSSKNNEISSYEVYRSRYLDLLTICKTYNIFTNYSNFITELLNEKQIKIDEIFDCIKMPDSIKKIALKNK